MKTRPVKIGPLSIGAEGSFALIAGPCSIENEDQLLKTSQFLVKNSISILRGGIYKLRTSPKSFQGLGPQAFKVVESIKAKTGLQFISEVTDPRQIGDLYPLVDAFQVGSRNMHNYELLKELGKVDKPILLKRGLSGLIKEWLLAGEYISNEGNEEIILCERGIRTFESSTRNTFDINAIAFVKQNSHFPIIADPSHGTGIRSLVKPISLAAAAAGADGLIIEIHPEPDLAKSDSQQTLGFEEFKDLLDDLTPLLKIFNKTIGN